MSKKILLLLLALCLTLGLCACAGGDNTNATTVPNNNQNETTAPNDETTGPVGTVYKVVVKDEQGNPVSGAMVQLCEGSVCKPKATDANGVAEYATEEADYEVKLMRLPTGYTYSTAEEVFTFAEGSYELTIVLKKTA